MSALTKARKTREARLKQIRRVLATAAVAQEGGVACIDTATGALKAGVLGTTLKPIGIFIDIGETPVTGDGTTTFVRVRLFKEVIAFWFVNDTGTPVTDAKFASPVYVLDDQTVTANATGASIAGRCWGVDATKGVLVEPAINAGL